MEQVVSQEVLSTATLQSALEAALKTVEASSPLLKCAEIKTAGAPDLTYASGVTKTVGIPFTLSTGMGVVPTGDIQSLGIVQDFRKAGARVTELGEDRFMLTIAVSELEALAKSKEPEAEASSPEVVDITGGVHKKVIS